MRTLHHWLEHWHGILEPGFAFQEPEDLRGVLNDVRWEDPTLEALFAPLPAGEAVLARVRACRDCQAREDPRPYVIPRRVPSTDEELLALTRDALARSAESGCPHEAAALRIERRELTRAEWGLTAPLTEALGDLFITERSVVATFLRETVYGLSACAAVRDYILTPTYGARLRAIDPWAPQFELWRRGADAVWTWGALGGGVLVRVDPVD
ncbi:MAG: hypothetical protein AAGH15_18180 [Myxococcota bacterium]